MSVSSPVPIPFLFLACPLSVPTEQSAPPQSRRDKGQESCRITGVAVE